MSSPVTAAPTAPTPPPRRPRSFAGPVVLIAIGVMFLLANFNLISGAVLWHWFARYWPVLIIVWGLLKLIDYYQAQRAGYQPRGIGGGGVFLLICLIIAGLAASGSQKVNWSQLGNEMDINDDVFSVFGQTFSYNGDLEQALPKNAALLRVVSDRGDVTVDTWDQDRIKVSFSKSVAAEKEADAKQIDTQTNPLITISGDTVTVNANTGGAGNKPVKSSLEIFVPRKMAVDLALKRGDISVRQRTGEVKAATTRGDASISDVTGDLALTVRHGSVTANKISGDVTLDGRIDDTTLSAVSGAVRMNGDFFGSISLSGIGKGVTFKSSRTDLQLAGLGGDFNMQGDELHATAPAGPVHIATHAKEIHLEDVSGDVTIEDSNADVEIHASKTPLGNINVNNRRGRIILVVPARAGFQLDARTNRGEIQSDFDFKTETNDRESHGYGQVGGGGPTVRLNTDRADIEIRKAS